MHIYTIETSYRLPVYRQRLYVATSLDEACRLAIADRDRRYVRRRHADVGPIHVSAAWAGPHMGYLGRALCVPQQYDDLVQRKADHFDVLLAALKQCLPLDNTTVQAAIANAEAILTPIPAS